MKAIGTILLGLMLFAPLCAAIDTDTIHTIHEGCEMRSKVREGNGRVSAGDWYNIGRTEGLMNGYADATSGLHGLPATQGEFYDAMCKYIDLHPELWNKSRMEGLGLILHTLYGGTK